MPRAGHAPAKAEGGFKQEPGLGCEVNCDSKAGGKRMLKTIAASVQTSCQSWQISRSQSGVDSLFVSKLDGRRPCIRQTW